MPDNIFSTKPAVTDLTGAEVFGLSTNPGVAGSTHTITSTDLANSTILAEAIRDRMNATIVGGPGTTVTPDDVANTLTIGMTTSTPYTAENARNDIAAALLPETDYIDITPNDVANTIALSISPTLKTRLTNLEKSTILQTKDNISSGSAAYINLTGASGAYISTPSSSTLNATGDTTWIIRSAMTDWTPGAITSLFSKWSGVANGSWAIQINTGGFPQVICTTDATTTRTATATTAPTVTDGTYIWLKITRLVSNGSVSFYYAADQPTIPTTWTTLTLNRATIAGAMSSSTADVEVGGHTGGTTAMMNGKVIRAQFTAATTVVADMNVAEYTSGTSWTGTDTLTWTLHGAASVVSGPGGVNSTNAEFNLAFTDAFASVPVTLHDTMFWKTTFAFVNSSGTNATYTMKIKLNGQDLFTSIVFSVPTTASTLCYTGLIVLAVDINSADGSTQISVVEAILSGAVTGSDLGSAICSQASAPWIGNRSTTTLTTFTSVPTIVATCQMSVNNVATSARSLMTQLLLAKA